MSSHWAIWRKRPTCGPTQVSEGRGLVIIYPISKDSIPMGVALNSTAAEICRRPITCSVWAWSSPTWNETGSPRRGTYYSVHPDWEVAVEEDDEVPEDREGSFSVDGEKVVPKP